MASPEMFSPGRSRRIAASPVVISSSPDFPSLQNIGSQQPRPPAFKSSTSVTPSRQSSRPGFTSTTDRWREPVNLSPSPKTSVHESHYRAANKEAQNQSVAHNDMARGHAVHKSARSPVFLLSPAKVASETTRAVSSNDALIKSSYFKNADPAPTATKAPAKISTVQEQDAGLNIDRAPLRRMDWTPPKQKASIVIEPGSSPPTVNLPTDDESEKPESFTKVLEAFKCADTSNSTPETRSDEDGSVFRKRKLIDTVSTRPEQSMPRVNAPVATKKKTATKKKPRTITGLATAAYKIATQPEPAADAVENQIGSAKQVIATTTTETPKETITTKPRKRSTKAPRKTKKKEAPPKPVLLSPSAALRQVANQDFLFGTSSQLAQDCSPRILRDLAAARRHSSEIDYVTLSTPINSDAIEPTEAKQSLWNAAARNEDGDLFDLGVQELAQRSQDLPAPAAQNDPFGYVKEASPIEDDSFLNLSDALQPPVVIDATNVATPRIHEAVNSPVDGRSAPCSQDAGLGAPPSELPELPPRPNFELYTDAQLASAVSSYGFKNVRQRGARIALLVKCWQGKSQINSCPGRRAASTVSSSKGRSPVKSSRAKPPLKTPARLDSSLAGASQPQEPPPSAQPMSPPKRPRGRPRKSAAPVSSLLESTSIGTTAAGSVAVATPAPRTPKKGKAKSSKFAIEIPDSESDADELDVLSASPTSIPDETFSPSQGVDLSLSMDADTELSISMSPCDEPGSFEYISKAITCAPRSKDTNNPTWHEKILMYDPIILEDLAAWLNCGALTKVGYDGEVSSGELKKWCESKSICCLWKVNLRGKERKRY